MTDEPVDGKENPYDNDPDVEMATIGIDLQTFISKKAGKYLVDRSTSLIDEGFSKIIDIDPQDDVKEFRKVQLEIKAAQLALTWIHEGIMEGQLAQEKINDEERDSLQGYRP